VILEVEATPALFHQETAAARRMMEGIEKLGLRPKNLAADKAYGSGEFLAWLMAHGVEPHIPVIDRRHQTGGRFTHDQFRYEPGENAYYCPEGKALRYRGLKIKAQSYSYCSTEAQCQGCPQKKRCTPGTYRRLSIHWDETARQAVRALVGTPAYERSHRARYKIEALFAELKQRMGLRRVRLRRLWNVSEQFLLAATAQNLKRLVRFLVQQKHSPAFKWRVRYQRKQQVVQELHQRTERPAPQDPLQGSSTYFRWLFQQSLVLVEHVNATFLRW
jgi:hypothetical protein